MNWQAIQTGWQSAGPHPDTSEIERLAGDARERARKMHGRVRRRDALETLVALLMAPLFGFMFSNVVAQGLWVSAAGSALLAVFCLYVPWRLHRARKLLPDPKASADMLSYLRQERRATRAQYELLRSILSWYLGPAAVGVSMVYLGVRGWSVDALWYLAGLFVLYGLIYFGNQRAATRRILPALEAIERLIDELDRNGERNP